MDKLVSGLFIFILFAYNNCCFPCFVIDPTFCRGWDISESCIF